ncbi:MAG: hypothetical protein KIT89_01965 [Microcella sp.]|uniref:hypothetical protein n=1 Tax=Microcella sp. TaxID=1913979 RepID=UPI0024CB57B7|nr:hypothetical protein [Microcella sp.]UYN84020.1 MAG: hypothetical protein KIT89_01965 [Microcella sp.]
MRREVSERRAKRRPTNSYSGAPRGTGFLPNSVLRLLHRHGGIVSTSELRSVHVDQTHLELLRYYGSLQAVRQGWHCHPSLPDVNRLAWRFGGPLACVSALAYYDALDSGREPTTLTLGDLSDDGRLHVCVVSNQPRIPGTALLARRWSISEPREPSIHWSTAAYRSGDRLAVARHVALLQADRCDDT